MVANESFPFKVLCAIPLGYTGVRVPGWGTVLPVPHISVYTPVGISGNNKEKTIHLTMGTMNSYYEEQAVWASLHTLEYSNSQPGGSL